jgi:membrane-associated protease RseP (regulator of RpoE activity)
MNYYIFDGILALLFLIFLAYFLVKNKKQVSLEKMLFPLFYAFLYRGQFGIKTLEKFANKFKEWIKIYGYVSIGVGFIGIILAFAMIIYVAIRLVFVPTSKEVAPFLPFTSVPGLGYISFLHWIIAIFIIVIVHEASHAIVAMAHGLKIKNTGFGLFAIFVPFLPAAFVEPDEKEVKKKSDVVQYSIFAAGPMSNFVLMIPIILMLIFAFPAIENKISEPVGFSFDAINDSNNYPALLVNLKEGQTFNTFNGLEYNNISGPYNSMTCLSPNSTVTFGYYNSTLGNYSLFYKLKTTNHPDFSSKGFLGINNLHTVYDVKSQYKLFEPIFSWLKGLFEILFVVTFAIGLINLFPAGMIDGGRMFMLALFNITKDKKKTEKIASILAAFFWTVILFSFITYFFGNPFSLIFG